MRSIASIITALLLLTGIPAMAGLPTQKCGEGHYIIRVDTTRRFVLLPIEDAAPEFDVRILTDGNVARSIDVRLAVDHVDYCMPLDLKPFAGADVILDIRSKGGDSGESVKEIVPLNGQQSAWLDAIGQSDSFDTTNTEAYRPSYHHTPLYGWMNDPNGMFYKDGQWHLFFQYGPYGSTWNNMTWGHSVSTDLLHWTQLDNAILPDGFGTIFSGSSVVDRKGTAGLGKAAIVSIYTQAGRSQIQSMSYSNDGGRTFTKYSQNPILVTGYEARDPNMFWHEESGRWILVLASAPAREIDIYSSDNLIDWTLESSFGQRYGCLEGVWECPDLMELNVRGTDEKRWVLICNVNPGGPYGGSATQYFVGTFDGHEFVCESAPEVTKWMDWGKDLYATVSWSNAPAGRHTMIGWMSNWEYGAVVPTTQYRSANSLPRDVELFCAEDGELYLASTPSPEVDAGHGARTDLGSFTLASEPVSRVIPEAVREAYEMDIELDASEAENVSLTLSNPKGEKVVMTWDPAGATFAMDRTASGITDFSAKFPCVTAAPCSHGNRLCLRLFFDHSSLEVFETQGRFTMTNLVFPSVPYDTLTVSGKGATVTGAAVYEMK